MRLGNTAALTPHLDGSHEQVLGLREFSCAVLGRPPLVVLQARVSVRSQQQLDRRKVIVDRSAVQRREPKPNQKVAIYASLGKPNDRVMLARCHFSLTRSRHEQ